MSRPAPDSQRSIVSRILLLFLFAGAAGFCLWAFGDELTLTKLAARESALRQFQTDQPVLVYFVAIALYVVVTGLSLPGAVPLTLLFAWLFGFWRGILVVSFGSTAGATVAFLFSRYLFRDTITRRFGDRLNSFNEALRREGAFYLFTLRLIPAVPFFVINAVMGLTPVRVRTFWWVSQLGMLPGTAVYVYAGTSVPRLQTLVEKGIGAVFSTGQITQILMAFVLLGLFPLIVRFLIRRFATSGEKSTISQSQTR
ncbi:MAG: TVP38/TMEM64 family protein [Planctomycetota bacterium]|nr:TVP38/TMEM64 family protein [Planctomycetota bacterium]